MRIKRYIATAMVLTSLLSCNAFAWNVEDAMNGNSEVTVEDIKNYASGSVSDSLWSSANAKALEQKVKANQVDGNTDGAQAITINGNSYYLDSNGIASCAAYMNSVASKAEVKDKVNTMGSNFNISADTATAGVALSGLEQFVSVVVGILCYAITIGMTLFTALDLCYITMPVFRNKFEDMKQSGNGAMTKTDKNTGETKLRWITDEAIYSVQSCSVETGKNPLTVYLKKRVIAFVMLAVVLYILFTGNIQLIVNIVINFVAGLMDALSTLGG